MREVRPTARVVARLPLDMMADSAHKALLRRKDKEIFERLYSLEHPILDAARGTIFEGHRAEPHRSTTKAAGRKVFEVRERTSGWRGAVVMDDAGDPWLVLVDEHDKFHARAANRITNANRNDWMPQKLDYEMRAREESAQELTQWRVDVANLLLSLLGDQPGCDTSSSLPAFPSADETTGSSPAGTVEISWEHDPLAENAVPSRAHEHHSLANLTVKLRQRDREIRNEFMYVFGRTLGRERLPDEIVYLPDDEGLVLFQTMTAATLAVCRDMHAQTVVALADPDSAEVTPPTHLHYAKREEIAQGLILGEAVHAVCGIQFVATSDQYSSEHLPVCAVCEADKHVAQRVLEAMRHITGASD